MDKRQFLMFMAASPALALPTINFSAEVLPSGGGKTLMLAAPALKQDWLRIAVENELQARASEFRIGEMWIPWNASTIEAAFARWGSKQIVTFHWFSPVPTERTYTRDFLNKRAVIREMDQVFAVQSVESPSPRITRYLDLASAEGVRTIVYEVSNPDYAPANNIYRSWSGD